MESTSPETRQRRRAQARRRQVIRRRRVALGTIAGLALIAGAVLGAGGGDGGGAGEPPAAADAPACPQELAESPRRLAGAMLVVRMEDEATPELLAAAREGEIGGVIVFPVEVDDAAELEPEIERLQRAARRGGNLPLLVMIDQEGGGASRFPLQPPQRSPFQLADFGTARDSRLEGQATGNFLRRVGIGIDLAPVLDVPESESSAMALRAFGDTPQRVARLGVAFAEGLADERTVAVPKHFPGLGRTDVSTDAAPVTIDASRRQLRGDLVPFREAIARGAEMIMVGLAAYPAFGSERPASFAPEIVDGLLRGELGFDGVVITDDVEAPAISAAGTGEGRAAVAAATAGVDLVLLALGGGGDALPALARAIRRERVDPGSVAETCARLVELRSARG